MGGGARKGNLHACLRGRSLFVLCMPHRFRIGLFFLLFLVAILQLFLFLS